MRLMRKLLSRGLSAEGVHEVIGHQQPSGADELLCAPLRDDGTGVVLQAESFSFRPSFQ